MVGSDVNKAARLEQLHSGDVYEGSRKLGAIRLSKEFFDCLSAPVQKRYQQSSLARVKGVKDLEVRSLSASLD